MKIIVEFDPSLDVQSSSISSGKIVFDIDANQSVDNLKALISTCSLNLDTNSFDLYYNNYKLKPAFTCADQLINNKGTTEGEDPINITQQGDPQKSYEVLAKAIPKRCSCCVIF